MNKLIVIALALMAMSSTVFADLELPENLPKGILTAKNRPSPPLSLSDVDGNKFNLADHKGRWIFVHFWASWCGPCRREIPAIQQLIETNKNKDLVFAIVNTAESEDAIFKFLGVLAPDIVSLMDRDGLVTEAWAPRGLPSTYFVDPEGVIRYQALGGRSWNNVEYVNFLNDLTVNK